MNSTKYSKSKLVDIIAWDFYNWSECLNYWSKYLNGKSLQCLELGAKSGGLSLWLGMNGHKVVCSDLINPQDDAEKVHLKYFDKVNSPILYRSINATNIPYENKFDIIIFKSILGGIGSNGRKDLINKTIDEIYSALKPGGILLFAENLKASPLHQKARKLSRGWGKRWNYIEYSEIYSMFKHYSFLEYKTYGFLGVFGQSENQRQILSTIDRFFDKLIPHKYKYIVFGVAKK